MRMLRQIEFHCNLILFFSSPLLYYFHIAILKRTFVPDTTEWCKCVKRLAIFQSVCVYSHVRFIESLYQLQSSNQFFACFWCRSFPLCAIHFDVCVSFSHFDLCILTCNVVSIYLIDLENYISTSAFISHEFFLATILFCHVGLD